MRFHVYELLEPVTGEARYVGVSSSLPNRLAAHKHEKNIPAKLAWFRDLSAAGSEPDVRVVSSHDDSIVARAAESARIVLRLSQGHRLFNRIVAPARQVRTVDTRARALLCLFLDAGRSQSSLARVLGITPSNVNRWRSGKSRPDVGLREAVRLATGIASDDWMTDEERAEETERLRRAAVGVPATPVAEPGAGGVA